MIAFLQAALAITSKDLLAEARSRQLLPAMLLFSLLAVLIFSFALELEARARAAGAAGILWVTLIFAGLLGLGRALAREKEQAALDALLLAPADRGALFLGKLAGSFIFIMIVALMMVPPLVLLFTDAVAPLLTLLLVSGVVTLGVLGYAAAGTLIAAMAVYVRGREVLLPVLLLPIALSVVVPAVRSTRSLLEGAPLAEVGRLIGLLVVLNVIYVTLGLLLFEFVVEE